MPHKDTEVLRHEYGDPDQALIMVHGRGARARGMVGLAEAIVDDALVLAPQAEDRTWYPNSFMDPVETNQPWLDGALGKLDTCLAQTEEDGFAPDDVSVIGFSQGACLGTEWTARRDPGIQLVAGLSGGLIGDEIDETQYEDDFSETQLFLGCSDVDPHIPVERVDATAEVFMNRGATADQRIYEGMGHTINDDERQRLADILG